MARRSKAKSTSKIAARPRKRKNARQKRQKSNRKARRPGISDAQLERGLRVLSETKDLKTAARSIHASVGRFERAAKRKAAIRKRRGFWTVVRRLPRRMPIFSGGRQLAITVRSNSATLIGRYNSLVAKFLRTNDPKFLAEFKGRGVKDVRGKFYEFTTDPNVLYRLSSAGNEPFEDIYRIVI